MLASDPACSELLLACSHSHVMMYGLCQQKAAGKAPAVPDVQGQHLIDGAQSVHSPEMEKKLLAAATIKVNDCNSTSPDEGRAGSAKLGPVIESHKLVWQFLTAWLGMLPDQSLVHLQQLLEWMSGLLSLWTLACNFSAGHGKLRWP